MALCSIDLGSEEVVTDLYSWPNIPDSTEPLGSTVLHWFNQTLQRDGADDVTATVRLFQSHYLLELDGPADAQSVCDIYAARLPVFLKNGLAALSEVVPEIEASGRWNPDPTNPGDVWRFFLPLGLPMANQRTVQFFHYPPIRLLNPMRDYLNDPVPVRVEEMLRANGVPRGSEALYECVMDAAPIAAPDDQGSKKSPKGDPKWGLIPIQDFTAYQKAQVDLLLNDAPGQDGYTIPIMVYGSHPRDIFNLDFSPTPLLKANVAGSAAIVAGKTTAVAATNHPYMFYAVAQGGANVGSGEIAPDADRAKLTSLMVSDLAAVRWQVVMADDPSQDPAAALAAATAYWADASRSTMVQALIEHQGSLYYPNADALTFTFKVPCPDFCAG
ncbi:MAG: hypothetical protein KGZ83_21890 [Sulfuricella sp.]|nr:hypothetical protein [Sulfuricella sp.]